MRRKEKKLKQNCIVNRIELYGQVNIDCIMKNCVYYEYGVSCGALKCKKKII